MSAVLEDIPQALAATAGPNAMDLSVLTWLGFSGAGGGREAVLVTECDVVPGAVVARAWR